MYQVIVIILIIIRQINTIIIICIKANLQKMIINKYSLVKIKKTVFKKNNFKIWRKTINKYLTKGKIRILKTKNFKKVYYNNINNNNPKNSTKCLLVVIKIK